MSWDSEGGGSTHQDYREGPLSTPGWSQWGGAWDPQPRMLSFKSPVTESRWPWVHRIVQGSLFARRPCTCLSWTTLSHIYHFFVFEWESLSAKG